MTLSKIIKYISGWFMASSDRHEPSDKEPRAISNSQRNHGHVDTSGQEIRELETI